MRNPEPDQRGRQDSRILLCPGAVEKSLGDKLPKEQDERRRLMGRGTVSTDTEVSSEVISTDGKRK